MGHRLSKSPSTSSNGDRACRSSHQQTSKCNKRASRNTSSTSSSSALAANTETTTKAAASATSSSSSTAAPIVPSDPILVSSPSSMICNLQISESLTDSHGVSLSTSSSNSLASVNSIPTRQIIIKIQLTKMENSIDQEPEQEQQQESEQQQRLRVLQAQDTLMGELLATDSMDVNANSQPAAAAAQVVNVTLNGNFVCNSARTSCGTAGSSASTSNRNEIDWRDTENGNCSSTATITPVDSNHGLQIREEYRILAGDVLRKSVTTSGSSRSKRREEEPSKQRETNVRGTNEDLPSSRESGDNRRQSKQSKSSTSGRFKRLVESVEPSWMKSNRLKERKENLNASQHSSNASSAAAPREQAAQNANLKALPSSSTLAASATTSAVTPKATKSKTTRSSATTNNSTHQSTVAEPSSAAVATTAAPLIHWSSNSRADVIIPIAAPQVVVVYPTLPSLVGMGGRNDDNASIRLVTTEIVSDTNNTGTVNTLASQPEMEVVRSTPNGPTVFRTTMYFVHCLVPDLEKIVNSSFYWGKMDRYEAERLLDGKPEGTFLLRDSAQEEFLFSVTFRKYGRSLHARIEQNGHRFSFDWHDPAVFSAPTVTGLLEHYKDPACVMFFEPMLTLPFHRKSPFSLQELCRGTIVSNVKYDGINQLELPSSLKTYLRKYHYKQRLRFRPFEMSVSYT